MSIGHKHRTKEISNQVHAVVRHLQILCEIKGVKSLVYKKEFSIVLILLQSYLGIHNSSLDRRLSRQRCYRLVQKLDHLWCEISGEDITRMSTKMSV